MSCTKSFADLAAKRIAELKAKLEEAEELAVDLEHEIKLVQDSLDRPVGYEWKPLVHEVVDAAEVGVLKKEVERLQGIIEGANKAATFTRPAPDTGG